MLGVVLVAVSLGLSNLAASIGIGLGSVDARTRLRVGVSFGIFETGVPILGLLLGRSLASTLGHAAHWIGGALLIATGGPASWHAMTALSSSAPRRATPAFAHA